MTYTKTLSYSGKSLYKRCPKAFKSAYVDGVRSEPGKAAQRGTILHEALENFFNGGSYNYEDKTLAPWRTYMERLTLSNPTPEGKIAVRGNWTPTHFDDPEAELRGAFDLMYVDRKVTEIFDWKSGKVYDNHKDQGEHYVAMLPETEGYYVNFVYLDQYDTVHRYFYNARDRREIQNRIADEVNAIRADTTFDPTPSNDACQWCALSWRRGGECKEAP